MNSRTWSSRYAARFGLGQDLVVVPEDAGDELERAAPGAGLAEELSDAELLADAMLAAESAVNSGLIIGVLPGREELERVQVRAAVADGVYRRLTPVASLLDGTPVCQDEAAAVLAAASGVAA